MRSWRLLMAGDYDYGWQGRVAAARQARQSCVWLKTGARVPMKLAEQLVAESTWWLTHPSGSPVRAAGHAQRLTHTAHGWCLQVGANGFLVSRAIERSRGPLLEAYRLVENGQPPTRGAVGRWMRPLIACSVSNHAGVEFGAGYPIRGGFLEFGATGILVPQVTSFLIRKARLMEFLRP